MSTEGVEGLYLETHSWPRSREFFEALGYKVEFDNGSGTGMFSNGASPYVLVSEIPADREPQVQSVLKVTGAGTFHPDAVVEVATPFEHTHYGTERMTIRDPDGRVWSVEARD
jgi:hypothetical protein